MSLGEMLIFRNVYAFNKKGFARKGAKTQSCKEGSNKKNLKK